VAVQVLMLVGAVASPVSAQQGGNGRPYRGIFGGGVGDAEHVLTLNGSAGGSYTAPVGATGSGGAGTGAGLLGGSVNYGYQRPRGTLQASLTSLGRYTNRSEWLPASHTVGAYGAFTIPVSARAVLALSQGMTYRPLHAVTSLPGVPGFDLAGDNSLLLDPALVQGGPAYGRASSDAALGYRLTRRNSISVHAGYQHGGLMSPAADDRRARVGVQFVRAITRGLSVRLGYSFSDGAVYTMPVRQFRHHDVVAGIDFSRALTLSLTPQTTASFGIGSTVVTDSDRSRFHVTGSARLDHEMGRTWNASLAYRRGVDVRGGVEAPVFSDAVTAGLGGAISRAIQFRSAVGTALGNVGVLGGNGFRSHYASAGVVIGFGRHIGVDVTYAHFRSRFNSGALLAPGVPTQFDRHTLRVAMNVWAPLLYRARR
jgi:hypothetical protein